MPWLVVLRTGKYPRERVRFTALRRHAGSATIYPMTTVLIVDDHPSFRASARAILEAEGFEVIGEAEDGSSAIAQVKRLRPDVVLLDVQLPDMDGFEVCEGCGHNGRRPSIVLVSSRDASDYGDLIERSGARGFIPKAELSGQALAALVE
jgi:DNA-binding NarL/FixJ family response regulator